MKVEPLVLRYPAMVKAQSRNAGKLGVVVIKSNFACARLHEVSLSLSLLFYLSLARSFSLSLSLSLSL